MWFACAGAPEKLATIIEGESLLNDATAYVSLHRYLIYIKSAPDARLPNPDTSSSP